MFKTMLIEDNSPFRSVFKEGLKSRFPSMAITEAADSEDALNKIGAVPPDLIFMDIRLPGENGLELTRRIKTDHPEITIIIFTSHNFPEYREAAARYKADYFLSKSSVASEEIFKLVKIILLERGFKSNGSDSAKATA
ncbi:MAG TPA: response regulator transcription factor [Thermodesulfobacteriota bacterium]|nr:response regulator transcription factor [Thermodesulfobacteriota bacterium]